MVGDSTVFQAFLSFALLMGAQLGKNSKRASTVSELNVDLNRVETFSGSWTCAASADTLAVLTADPYDPTESFGTRATYVDGTIGAVGYNATVVREAVTTAQATGAFSSTCEPRFEAHEWKKPENYNFDNIGASMLVLFETATLEMWLEVMYTAWTPSPRACSLGSTTTREPRSSTSCSSSSALSS